MTARSARRRIGTSLAAVLARARREARRFPAVPLVLVGAGCGLVAVLFHHALTLGRFLLVETALSVASPWFSAALVLLLPASVGGLLAFAMRRFSPHAGGGLALVRRAYAQGHGILDRKTFFGAFVANPLSLGAGTPLGPEGPTVVLTSSVTRPVTNRWATTSDQANAITVPAPSLGGGMRKKARTPRNMTTSAISIQIRAAP